jgi:flagellar basal-body rod protein FlgB
LFSSKKVEICKNERDFTLKLFSGTFQSLERALDYSSLKQKVIANNIANVDTPNYKAKDVSFRSEFQRALQAIRTDPRHFEFHAGSTSFPIITRPNITYNHNGNSVDIDKEMSELAENQIYYNALVERMNGKFQTLKTVIRGGK